MSVHRNIDIRCDECGKFAGCNSHTVAQARELTREFGWQYKWSKDICLTCATGEEEEVYWELTL